METKEQVYLVSWGLPGSVGGGRNQVKGRIMPQLFTSIKLVFRFFLSLDNIVPPLTVG